MIATAPVTHHSDHMAEPQTPPLPTSLPVLPLRRTVAFPQTLQPLAVNRPASVESVNAALAADRMLLLVLQTTDAEEADPTQLESVGTIGVVRQMARAEHGLNIIFEGVARVQVKTVTLTGTSMRAEVEPLPERLDSDVETEAYERRIRELAEKAVALATGASSEVRQLVLGIEDPLRLSYLLGSMLDASAREKQDILAADPLARKLELVHALLAREVSVLELKGKIESQAQAEMSESQRQYYLRQQLKAIQEQLGEGEASEVTELREKVEKANLPEPVKLAVDREIDRLVRMGGSGSGEAQMIRTYLDWVLEVPWAVATEDRIDPVAARAVLDEDHYDLDKVKDRIVEYLAVRKLKGDMKGPILCFVGPPGVGKTSLGQSIARAMDRKFVRISLGGVRDEAEIRGHRRTYIGAMPGRIVQALKQAGSMNPVFMLDELDKLAVGFQGDPAAALLEVLDPAQNHTFRDHYLEVPLDLSKVLFIATANQLGPVHPALLDRMEIISLTGYTEEDKVHIARTYLIPRQLTEHGLTAASVAIDDAALRVVIARVHARGRRPQPRTPARDDRPEDRRQGRDRRRARPGGHHGGDGTRHRRLPGARPLQEGSRVSHIAARRGHRPGLDRGRRRRALHRGVAAPRRQGGDHPHRPARQRHAGVGPRRRQSHPRRRRSARCRSGVPPPPRPARARAGRRDSQGRAVGRRHDGHGDPLGRDRPRGA